MKRSIKSVLITFMLLATLLLVTACVDTSTPYDKNNAEGYTVSVKFDANGGYFTTNTSTILDSFKVTDMTKNGNGNVELGLLSPDDARRGEGNYFAPARNGYFLAGWYTERTETGKDADGNPIYTYANKWEFDSSTYEVDPSKEYDASEPVLTLYAAWIPMFQINFYSVTDGELIGNYTYNPMTAKPEAFTVPHWSEETGAMEMYNFPVKLGYTFEAAYYDKAATERAEDTITHTGTINKATGTAENTQMDMYVEMVEGEWFHIYSLEQFLDNAKITGSYILHTDLDFGAGTDNEEAWPSSLMYGAYTGTIEGNGHKIMNVNLEQKNNAKINAGLFGTLGKTAQLKDVTFENVTFTISAGTRTAGASFGLLAGTVSAEAKLENVKVLDSTILVNEAAYFGTPDYAIGKFCGIGYTDGMDHSGIAVKVLGEEGKLTIQENGNEIVLEFK